jgi:hypothetical protein
MSRVSHHFPPTKPTLLQATRCDEDLCASSARLQVSAAEAGRCHSALSSAAVAAATASAIVRTSLQPASHTLLGRSACHQNHSATANAIRTTCGLQPPCRSNLADGWTANVGLCHGSRCGRSTTTRAESAAILLYLQKLRAATFAAWHTVIANIASALKKAAMHAARAAASSALHAWHAEAAAAAAHAAQLICAFRDRAARSTAAAALAAWRRAVLQQRRLLYCFLLVQQSMLRTRLMCALHAWRQWTHMHQRKRAAVARAILHRDRQACSIAIAALHAFASRRRRHRAATLTCVQFRVRRWLRAWHQHAVSRAARQRLGAACVLLVRRAKVQRCLYAWHRVALHKRRVRIMLARAALRQRQQLLSCAWSRWTHSAAASALLRRVFRRAETAWRAWHQERMRLDFDLVASTFGVWAQVGRLATAERAKVRAKSVADTFRCTHLRVKAFHSWRAAAAAAAAATAAESLQRMALLSWWAAATVRGGRTGSRTAARAKTRAAGFASEVDFAQQLLLRRTFQLWLAATGILFVRVAAAKWRMALLRRTWTAWWTQVEQQRASLRLSRLRCSWHAWQQFASYRALKKVWFLSASCLSCCQI